MKQTKNNLSPIVRLLAIIISALIISLGTTVILQAYAPGRLTRFGYAAPLTGAQAKEFGFIMIMIGGFPLLLLCNTARQSMILGTVLGVSLVSIIFFAVYSK